MTGDGIRPTNVPIPTQTLTMQGVVTAYRGPLPDPAMLAAYKAIEIDLPDRIVRMAEQNAATERRTTERSQTFSLVSDLFGRVAGLAFASGGLVAAVVLALHGHDTVAGVIGGTTIIGVVAALITGKSP